VPGSSDDTRAVLQGSLHLWPNGGLFLGADMVNEAHRHFTASIIVGLDGPVRVRAEPSREPSLVDGIMVAPNVEQELDARGSRLATMQIDPESDAYARIAHHFTASGVHVLPPGTVERVRRALRDVGESSRAAFEAWSLTLEELASSGEPRRPLDPRIRRALGIIKNDVLAPPPASKLAAAIGLSPGRLIHLFTREMGLPIRRYVLWLRLRDVLISLCAGSSLTEAAHHAGFSDSAHLSRTFRGMFGFPPSAIADGRGRVRISWDLDVSRLQESPHPPIDADRLSR
jgi:AraC-like DNA-binding protein